MSRPAIRVEHLSKRYRLGLTHAGSIRELAARATNRLLRRKAAKLPHELAKEAGNSQEIDEQGDFWALKDVSFEVHPGEAIGIVGRNGAGKSTLLKVLSRITAPTEGRAELNGRVASLLEVGTGFHPELTGRENVFLNGAILGMTKAEIRRKFDEIVAFAELKEFMNTPVKRYSSGMYVRLAFSVAAHLESEILIVDEVLAVGDGAFQEKCLGKMGSVTRSGRTVLFVSHNLRAVQSLCSTALQLRGGRFVRQGSPAEIAALYMADMAPASAAREWDLSDAPGNSELRLLSIRADSSGGPVRGRFSSADDVLIELEFEAAAVHPALSVGFDLVTADGICLFRSYHTDPPESRRPVVRIGRNRLSCRIAGGLLNGGAYFVRPRIGLHNIAWIVDTDAAIKFEVALTHGDSPLWNSNADRNGPGIISPVFDWEILPR